SNLGARQWHLPHLNRSEVFTMSSTEYIRHGGDEAAHEHHHHDPAVEPYPWSDAKRYLWLLGLIPAAGLFLSMPFVIGFNALGVVPAADPRLRRHPARRPQGRRRRPEPAGRGDGQARGGPVLPVVYLPVHPAAVRLAHRRLLPVDRERSVVARLRRRARDRRL